MVVLAIPPGVLSGIATLLLAIRWTGTISIGVAALAGIAAVGTIVGIIYGVRWKTAYEVQHATSDALAERAKTLASERADLDAKLKEATTAIRNAEVTIARLEALPNLQAVLELMTATFDRIMNRVEELHTENRDAGADRMRVLVEKIDELRRAA